ncbi:MAG: hypothetical protein KDI50_07300 [Candidatus Competibacteraceae bacterium]|nr:hypothetical protein [Candidatus Competibacteraceae bacterium]
MDKSLLIAVFVPTTNEQGEDFEGKSGARATGYPVGKDLILTARHVLHPESPNRRDPRYPIAIRWHYFHSSDDKDKGWIEIADDDIVWESKGELDAALIRCHHRPPDAVGWGIVSRDQPRDGVQWISEGFPRATKYDNRRNPSSFIGKVCSKASQESYFELTVETAPEDEEGWKGVSGMPVFVDHKILGVVRSAPPNFSAKKLHATPMWKLHKDDRDDRFRELIGDDKQAAHFEKTRSKLIELIRNSPGAGMAIQRELPDIADKMVGLNEGQKAESFVEHLLKTDIRTVIQALRDAHRSFCEDDGEQNRSTANTLTAISQLIVPALYDYGVVRWVGGQYGDGSAALVPLPACTKTVAEIIMAGVDGRATRYRHREDEDDQPEGALSLPHMPEGGIDTDNAEVQAALQRHLDRKFNLSECDAFRRAVDDYLLTTFPRRVRRGSERIKDDRIKLTADLLESKRRDSGQTFYMIFDLPKDVEGQNAMRTMVASLKKDYSALMFLCLDDSSEHEREEVKLVDPFCRMLPRLGDSA